MTHFSTTDEGELVVITYVEDGVDVTTILHTWPMKSALLPGLFIFSLATILLAFIESVVRDVVKQKMKNTSEPIDTKPAELPEESSGIWQEPVRPE